MYFTKVCAVPSNNYVSPNAKRCDKMNAIFILIATLKWCETARAVATFFQHLNDNRQSSRVRMSSKLSTTEFSLDLTHFRVDFFFVLETVLIYVIEKLIVCRDEKSVQFENW